ncbi:MAG: nitroreductase family protein [Actinobacteria bacterium]|nr:nitroreductase family protein [Actinomycetota bacterium]
MRIDKEAREDALSLEDAIFARRTVRKFQPKPATREMLEKVIEAGTAAPSPLNSQPWRFMVVAGEKRDELVKILRKFPAYLADILALYPGEAQYISEESITKFAQDLGGAPVVVIVYMGKRRSDYAHRIDLLACGAAIQNMQLTAWSLGLGSVCLTSTLWIESEIMVHLGLKDFELVAVLPMGYPEAEPAAVPRNPDVTTWIGL